jgi:hypothetical protein
MEWIDREIQFPNAEQIICYHKDNIFISRLIESKYCNIYCSNSSVYQANPPDWTHWMMCPALPKD